MKIISNSQYWLSILSKPMKVKQFSVYQLLNLIEQRGYNLSEDRHSSLKKVCLRANEKNAFPTADIDSVMFISTHDLEIFFNFFRLTQHGVIDEKIAQPLATINHQLYYLTYKLWKKYRLHYEDHLTTYLIKSCAQCYLSGQVNIDGLTLILSRYLPGYVYDIQANRSNSIEFQGFKEFQNNYKQLGLSDLRLNHNILLGNQMIDAMHSIDVIVGPMSLHAIKTDKIYQQLEKLYLQVKKYLAHYRLQLFIRIKNNNDQADELILGQPGILGFTTHLGAIKHANTVQFSLKIVGQASKRL